VSQQELTVEGHSFDSANIAESGGKLNLLGLLAGVSVTALLVVTILEHAGNVSERRSRRGGDQNQ
jgi:hypothetical protein